MINYHTSDLATIKTIASCLRDIVKLSAEIDIYNTIGENIIKLPHCQSVMIYKINISQKTTPEDVLYYCAKKDEFSNILKRKLTTNIKHNTDNYFNNKLISANKVQINTYQMPVFINDELYALISIFWDKNYKLSEAVNELLKDLSEAVATMIDRYTINDEILTTLAKVSSNEIKYNKLYNFLNTPYITVNYDTLEIVAFNEALCNLFNYPSVVMNELSLNNILPKTTISIIKSKIKNGENPFVNLDTACIKNGNSKFMANCSVSFLTLDTSKVLQIGFKDISQEELNRAYSQLLNKIYKESNDAIIITDINSKIIEVNSAFEKITGYSKSEVLGKSPAILKSGIQSREFYNNMWLSIKNTGSFKGEIVNRKKNGELYTEWVSISKLVNEVGNVEYYLAIFTDITELKNKQKEIEFVAHYDGLTKLPNRILFETRFNMSLAQAKRAKEILAVCFLDMDDFKPINDTYGHNMGDLALVEVAKRLKELLREEDTVARIGGDEFALILTECKTKEEVLAVVKRVKECLSEKYEINGVTFIMGVSIGISLYPHDAIQLDTLMRNADAAMYQAKLKGKNCHEFYNIATDEAAKNKVTVIKTLEEALKNKEYVLHYQPKVNIKTQKVACFEALIRWDRPEEGLIYPADFLPIMDGSSLEIEIGGWVIAEAIKQVAKWHSDGMQIKVSINVSPNHILSGMFIHHVDSVLATVPWLDSSYVEFEILESSVIKDLYGICKIINECKNRLGVTFSLDDFGTGYSSLTHLRNLNIDFVKIDQSFVRDMVDDPNDYEIVNGVLGLSKAFSKGVVAEGVETLDIGKILSLMGCHLFQGYAISKPMKASDVDSWIKNYSIPQEWNLIANNKLTYNDPSLEMLAIELKVWRGRVENCLRFLGGTSSAWPIMKKSKCHCGKWININQESSMYPKENIIAIDKLHSEIHQIGTELMELQNSGKINKAKSLYSDFAKCYNELSKEIIKLSNISENS